MEVFILTLVILSASIIGMAVGVILSNRQLKGSCGGLNNVIGEDCMFCEKKEECEENVELAKDCLDLKCEA